MRRNTRKRALSTKIVFFGCKKSVRQQKKKEIRKRTDKKELMYKNVKNKLNSAEKIINLFVTFLYIAPGLSFSLLPSSFVVYLSPYTRRRQRLSKVLVYYCFLVFRRVGDYISPDLFNFVNLTSSCSLIPQ